MILGLIITGVVIIVILGLFIICCAFLPQTIEFISFVIVVTIVLFIVLISGLIFFFPLAIPTIIALIITFFIQTLGTNGLKTLYSVFSLIRTFVQFGIDIYNPFSLLLPQFFTAINLLLKILIILFQGAVAILCPGNDPSCIAVNNPLPSCTGAFNAFTDCTLLNVWLALAPGIPQFLFDLITFIGFINEAIAAVAKPIVCIFDLPDCTRLCADLSLAPGCYNYTNLLTWIFLSTLNIIQFGINAIDFIFSFLVDVLLDFFNTLNVQGLRFSCTGISKFGCLTTNMAPVSGVCDPLSCTMINRLWQMAENLFLYSPLFDKVVLSIVILYLLSPVDLFFCSLFSGPAALIACFGRALCIALGFGSLFIPIIGIIDLCPPASVCPCQNCPTGWVVNLGLLLIPTSILAPCTISPGCVCNPFNTFMIGIINSWASI